jgi:hypothetical protein
VDNKLDKMAVERGSEGIFYAARLHDGVLDQLFGVVGMDMAA